MRKCTHCKKKYPNNTLICPDCGKDLKYPEGKKIAIISLILITAPIALETILGFVLGALEISYESIELLVIPLALSQLSGCITAIIGYAKYPGNTFCKVLFWIVIGYLIYTVVSTIILIIICGTLAEAFFSSCSSAFIFIG